jgi:hypothetical protein
MKRLRSVGATAITLILLVGCGGAPRDRLRAAADTVGDIRSGMLDMRLSLAAAVDPGAPIGFEIEGPFAATEDGLETDLRYRQLAGRRDAEVRFVAADGRAFVESDGEVTEISLSEDASTASPPSVLDQLSFEEWAADPRVVEDGADGEVTIESSLNEDAAVRGILQALDGLGFTQDSGLRLLVNVDPEVVQRSVRSGTMVVRVGAEDELLRELTVRLRLGIDEASPLAGALEDVAGAGLLFSVKIEDPNAPVHVELPAGA